MRDGAGRARTGLAAALVMLTTGLVLRRLRIAVGMRRGDQRVVGRKRRANQRLANRLVRRIGRAGRRGSLFGVIHVTGRRSGRPFATPVRPVEVPGGFLVPLTYGPNTDWYRNLQAAPGRLVWQGVSHPIGNPRPVDVTTVLPHLPPPSRFLLWLDGTRLCIRVEEIGLGGVAGVRPCAATESP